MAQKNSGRIPIPKISYNILRTSAVLLNMEYKPSELARELRINPKTILRSYLPAGLPHRRDEGGNIWIVGTKFDTWARVIYKNKQDSKTKHAPLRDDQVWCVRCNAVVIYVEIIERKILSHRRQMLIARCPSCGIKVIRFLKGVLHD